MRHWKPVLGALVASGLIAAAAFAGYVRDQLRPLDLQGAEQTFAIQPGAGLSQIAHRLESERLIRNARAFVGLARYHDLATSLHAGEYLVSPSWSASTILDHLVAGRVRTYPVVIPEGLRASEIAARIEHAGLAPADAFLEAVHDAALASQLGLPADDLEGYLFPDTYRLPKGLSGRDVARLMVEQFERVWHEIEPLAGDSELDRHEIVTLASIVEKETGAAEERPVIAAVFLNRLKRGMRLETDPTVIFGIPAFDGNLRRAHLDDASNPYNTYRIRGLPPGPIASPGRDALHAVVKPADSNYLFFVSRGDGTHHFSVLYADHDRAVDRYQRRRRR
ncbi:MAG: endolytic transglycosylase MltG [Myxococcota bacterium]|nr:endolytic transglycosylase MltG [Myxococcota bacterium]